LQAANPVTGSGRDRTERLSAYGIPRQQTLAEIAPIQIREAHELAEAYTHVGRNDRIGLTGRPLRQLRTLATPRCISWPANVCCFLPQCLNQKGFYLAMDNRLAHSALAPGIGPISLLTLG